MTINVIVEQPGLLDVSKAEAARIATAADRVQTGEDRVATGQDRAATAADRVQTGLDRASATASATSAALSSAAAGSASGRLDVASFAQLATKLVYADPGAGQEIVSAGDVILWRGEGVAYEVLASGASGAHLDYTGSGGVKLKVLPFEPGKYHVAQIGATGTGNETAIIQAFADGIPAGSELHFDGLKTYTLNVTTENSIVFQCNGATFINGVDDEIILGIAPESTTDYPVTETELARGATQFTVSDASNIDVGDIGTLWDNSLRPLDSQPVNFETVKIASKSGNVLTIEGQIYGHQGAGDIIFRHSTTQIKNAGILNPKFRPNSTHTFACGFVAFVDGAVGGGADVEGNAGDGLSYRNCYNVNIGDNRFVNPRLTGSGQGYGLAVLRCTNGLVGDQYGHACRHVLDFDSSYAISHGVVTDMAAKSSPLIWQHTGFGSDIRGDGVRCRLTGVGMYALSTSGQGYGTGANRAAKSDHRIRNCSIGFVDCVKDTNANTDDAPVVYFQNGVDNVSVGLQKIVNSEGTALASGAVSTGVRVDGPIYPGGLKVAKISANKLGQCFRLLDDDGYAGDQGVVQIDSISVDDVVSRFAFFRGGASLKVNSWFAGGNVGDVLFETVTLGSNTPKRVDIGPGRYLGTDTQVFSTSAGIEGQIATSQKSSGSSLSSPSGATYTKTQIQNRSGLVRIVGDVGSGTDAITSFPAPDFNGQIIRVLGKFSGRNDVTIPAAVSVTNAVITFDTANPAKTLVGYAGKWLEL